MRERFRKILSPLAFDDNSLAALDYAARLVRDGGGKLFVLHAVPADAPLNGADSEQAAYAKLREVVRQRLGDLETQLLTQVGDPADVILTAEKDLDTDLVVMSTHGRKGLRRLLLGSVAEKVIRESSCPVLTVPSTG